MPHASTGTQHACPGASGPVTLKNRNTITAGNCHISITDGYRWCRKHENLCKKHDWTYSKKDECKSCQEEKTAKKKNKEEEDKKRKRDKDDEGKTLKKTSSGRRSKKLAVKKPLTPSSRKMRSTTAAEMAAAMATNTNVDHWRFWLSGDKVIDLDRLLIDTIAQPDEQLASCPNPNCAHDHIRSGMLISWPPYSHTSATSPSEPRPWAVLEDRLRIRPRLFGRLSKGG